MLRLEEEKLSFTSYIPLNSDYCRTFKNAEKKVTIGTAEVLGDRKTQEDDIAVSMNAVAHSTELDSKKIQAAHAIAYDEMQKKYGKIKNIGSTGCTATTWIDEKNQLNIITANLGDSAAYLVVLNKDNKIVTTKSYQLTKPHKPSDPLEEKRIRSQGEWVTDDRIKGELAVSRAFGDTFYKGISHEPDTFHHQINLKKDERAFVIVACDGLETLSLTKIQKLVKNNSKESPATIANVLVNSAKKAARKGRSDNISAAVIPVTTNPVSASVFDGHGGDIVAKNVGSNFYSALEKTFSSLITGTIENAHQAMLERVKDFTTPNQENSEALENLRLKFNTKSGFKTSLGRNKATMVPFITFSQEGKQHNMTALEELAVSFNVKTKMSWDFPPPPTLKIYCPDRMPWPDNFREFIDQAITLVNSNSHSVTNENTNEEKQYVEHQKTLRKILGILQQHDKNKKDWEKELGRNLEILLREVDKNSSSDFATAFKILDSHIKIFKNPSEMNMAVHNKLTNEIQQKPLRWKKAAAAMAVIGGILLIAASALVAAGTWGMLSIPAIATGSAGVSLVLSGLGFFAAKNSKIPTSMENLETDAHAIHRITCAKYGS